MWSSSALGTAAVAARAATHTRVSSNWKVKVVADALLGIGELARRAGVPVKTLRYWSDLGLVPPATRTAAGYRRYGEAERLRLETVKTLRGLGFGLREINATLDGHADLLGSVELQLRAVGSRIAELQRTAVVLQAALDRRDEPTAAHLARLETLARMSGDERAALLDGFLDRVRGDAEVDAGWWAQFRAVSLPQLPDEPNPDQLDAWLELAELLADDDYRDHLRRLTATSWTPDSRARQAAVTEVLADALDALRRGVEPTDAGADDLVARFVAVQGGDDGATPDAVLADIDRRADPRSRRYWALVNRIHQWPAGLSHGDAFDWLFAALRVRTT